MAGLWSDHFPASGISPEILPGSCNSIGAWSEHFPSKPSPSAALSGYERCLLCRTCGVSCRLYTSKTSKNPNRQYYKCLASPDHDFFKWADEVRPDELIDVPDCGGCGAGTCRVKREKRGPNSGRVLFMCRIKEGEGSCGYGVWQDELQKSATRGPNENITLSQSPTINADFLQENSQSNESTVTDTSWQHPDFDGSEAHNKPLLNPCHSTQLSYTNPPHETSFQTLLMSESISKAFTHAAENLQNDFLALLEEMDVSDYEAMRRESEATFSALDRLHFNYRDLKDRAEEYISCAISLAEIERSVFGYECYRERIEHYSSERMRLDEVRSDYAKASERLKSNRKRLRSLQGMVSSTKDWVFKVETELSCFEVEMRDSERDLEKIWKEKEELEEKNAAAGRELEEIMERKEAAKAALENARVLLRAM